MSDMGDKDAMALEAKAIVAQARMPCQRPEQESLEPHAVDVCDLAKMVLEWAKEDAFVKEHGWDHGKHDEAWDRAKMRMVELSAKVLGVEVP